MSRLEERQGWSRKCPVCGEPIRFTTLRVDPPTPFFYSSTCSDILLRRSDRRATEALRPSAVGDAQVQGLWETLLGTAPTPPCGGEFALWANFHCPRCGSEVPYNRGVRDLHRRLWEPLVVVVDGATVVGDSEEETWVAKVITEDSVETS
jgi:endogenous inhibitor of DNA gyrase (YacG/DUF329 family)